MNLSLTNGRVINIQDINGWFFFQLILVYTDDNVFATIDACLAKRRSLLDSHLGHTGLNRPGHTAHLLNFLDQLHRRSDQFICQALHVIGTRQRVYNFCDSGLFPQNQLCIPCDTGRKLSG